MSEHKRNITGMLDSVKEKRDLAIERVKKVLIKMENNNHTEVTFNKVAKEAGVSKAWLYRETEIREKIKFLRNKALTQATIPQEIIKANNNIVISMKSRIKKLEQENLELRKQLEVVYGKIYIENIN